MSILSTKRAVQMGYSPDKRKRRNQHRTNARNLQRQGGGTCRAVAAWHLAQARAI